MHPDADKNDLRLVFEIEFVKQLYPDYIPIKLKIWDTFTDTTLCEMKNKGFLQKDINFAIPPNSEL